MKKVILVDGNNLLFRSYYATSYTGNVMRNSKGFPTNAIYGFINMINKIIHEENPEYIMIAFDKGKTFRHDKYESYKDGRNETPDDLKQQFPIAKQICEAMGMKYFEIDNYEADDIIGTFASKVEEDSEYNATIISSDKDLLQLISDEIDVKLLKQTGYIRMDKNLFKETYGVEPIGMIDLKALMGDASDNIPGVKGIGEKTAISLLKEYQTLDNLYEHIDEIKGKTKEKLIADKENAYMSKDIATIYREVPIDTTLENIRYTGIDVLKYVEILEELEFYSLIKKLDIPEEIIKENKQQELTVNILDNIENFKVDGDYAVYLEILGLNYHNHKPLGVALYNEKTSVYIPFELLKTNPSIFLSENKKYTYDLKKLWYVLRKNNMDIKNCDFDTMIAAYLLNENIKDDIAYLANTKNYNINFYEEIYGKENKEIEPEIEVIAKKTLEKARFIYETKDLFEKKLEEENEINLFKNIEMPLVEVLMDMELTGIKVNDKFLNEMGIELDKKIVVLEKEIYEIAGEEFNISSPKQLGIILFEKLGIPYPKKIKDNSYSTSKEILDKLVGEYPIIDKILEYRMLTKLKTNYITGLLSEIKEDGKIHTIFTQTLTRTGRLSSISPNLQNIPIRTEEGRLIRKAFIAEENSCILSSDYSQIELRIFASLANVDNLIHAFESGKDIHAKTASDIFKVPLEEVTTDMRRTAKAVNFGILYGISSFGLSEDLGIDIISAKEFIGSYLNAYPEIKQYMEEVIKSAHEKGYVKTIMNRKRTIEELKSKMYLVRSQGERIALNTPIQGSSADILKKAMIEIFKELNDKNLKSKMLIQVHDELVFNVYNNEKEEVEEIVRRIMENTYRLNVPLKVEIESGNDWYEAK
ncbi:MAG: DNA polymerase I [Firmicutes bacterium]|nr:DNA polymerase I [Bacillota bacterium]